MAAPTVAENFKFGNKHNVKYISHYFMTSAHVWDHTVYIDFLDVLRIKMFGRSGLETLTEEILFPITTARWVLVNRHIFVFRLTMTSMQLPSIVKQLTAFKGAVRVW